MGLFKGMKDMAKLTKQAQELQKQQQAEAGYKPGVGGMMSQMGDMVGQATEQMADLTDQPGDRSRLMAEGIDGTGTIVAMGTPARGAQRFNLDIDLEIHVSGRAPYRVANQYIVPASAPIGQGVTVPVKVDPADQAKIAIVWEQIASAPARGEIRSAGGGTPARGGDVLAPTPVPAAGSAVPAIGGSDSLAELERLAKLRDSGALTDAEFEQQKARILSS